MASAETHSPDCATGASDTFHGKLQFLFTELNHHHFGMDVDEDDFSPDYVDGQLVAVKACKFDNAMWMAIEKYAPGLTDLGIAMPHLNGQSLDDAVRVLQELSLRHRLKIFEVGPTERQWHANVNYDDFEYQIEGEHPLALVKLIEDMPALEEFYLSCWLPGYDSVLKAAFPPNLRLLFITASAPIKLEVLAQNAALGNIQTLVIRRTTDWDLTGTSAFQCQFKALVNSPHLKNVERLAIVLPEVDNQCCKILVDSPVVKHLRGLRLTGKRLSNAGAITLAASPDVQALEELYLDGKDEMLRGRKALHAAGVKLKSEYPQDPPPAV